jgi:hypothetical protein
MTTILYFFFFVQSDASIPFVASASDAEVTASSGSSAEVWKSMSSDAQVHVAAGSTSEIWKSNSSDAEV